MQNYNYVFIENRQPWFTQNHHRLPHYAANGNPSLSTLRIRLFPKFSRLIGNVKKKITFPYSPSEDVFQLSPPTIMNSMTFYSLIID